ncbi:nucleolar complex protein 2 homolog [Phtheirospermum japonicum]|uniref:Nucleolar complex protein 2 homolog n=1 Tax=Phtheirospermum japonicum TaxID=374723 RepID=A0A830CJ14_9LAMI|nr:nucleolar complex protein 2 homolog [Phtheirospermum japonicum]
MGSKSKAKKLKEESEVKQSAEMENEEAKEHIGTLRKLPEKQREFYEYLKENDKELLEFEEEGLDDNVQTDAEDDVEETGADNVDHSGFEAEEEKEKTGEPSRNVITSEMVDSWCDAIRGGAKLGAVRSLLRAFRSACHYGDDAGDDPTAKLSTMSSPVFNKIMLFVLKEMDGILRGLLKLPPSGGKKEMIMDLITKRPWKNFNHLVKSYLGNALHVLNQMTDNEMIAFMLRRLKYSSVFLAAFPALLRKYTKVALHFWGTGSGALPVHIQFLGNCFTEVLRVDMASAYQHAFVYIRQLAMILKETLSCSSKKKKTKNKGNDEPSGSIKEKGKEAPSSSKKKETFRKVYQWKYINCLELWTGVICATSSEVDLRPLAYPLTQIITGVARLLPSACYFPLRLRCVRMLNRIGAATGAFVPVSLILLDMLEIKELRRPPTGGIGKAVSKSTLKTRAFQEACVSAVVEGLAEHLSQWSYSIAFMELSFVPSVRLRNFCKSTKVDRFRKQMRHLTRQIEATSDFINKKRTTVSFLPNDPAAETFLEDEKNSGTSPLSQYVATLRQIAKDRIDALTKSRSKREKNVKKKNLEFEPSEGGTGLDEDIIEDFVLSDDEDYLGGDGLDEEDSESDAEPTDRGSKKRKQPTETLDEKAKPGKRKSKKRKKRAHGKM